ncbi:MAG: PAS domain-containing protein, partial [Dehalococcoidales bacterium]|nr:PAS domain-containing protein [Dehalococcoidales bacterium]
MADEYESTQRILPMVTRMIEAMSEAVLIIDHPGRVVAINQVALDLLDLPDKGAALRPLDEYEQLIRGWRVGEEPFAPTELGRALDGQTIPRQVATLTTAANVERIVEFTATPIVDERGRVILAFMIASDITREERTRGYWQAVATAARGLSGAVELDQVLEMVLDQMIAALGGQVAIGVWQMEDEDRRLALLASRRLSESTLAMLRSLPLDCETLICEAARTRRAQHIDDARQVALRHELDRRLAEGENLGSLTVAPLVVQDRLFGVMAYGLHASHRLYEDDDRAVEVVSGLFAEAIDRAMLHREMQEINRELVVAGVREQELAEEYEAARNEVTSILERISDAFFAVDRQWRFTYVSLRAAQVLRTSREEIIGRKIWDAFPEALGSPFQRECERALSEQVAVTFEACYQPFATWFEVHAYPAHNGLTVYFQDITDRRRIEEFREEYIRLISHDLRGPLTIILGMGQWLERQLAGAARPREASMAGRIVTSAHRMTSMIQDLVDSARLEAGKTDLHKGPTNLL